MANSYPDRSSRIRLRPTLSALLAAFFCMPAFAQEELITISPDAPITIDADSSEFDYETSKLVFRGVRMDQGTLGIEADIAQTDKLDLTDGVWFFTGNVQFEADTARLYCDRARLRFVNHQLAAAELHGEPARFEQLIADSDQINEGYAEKIVYEFDAGTLQLSSNAHFSDGSNEISGDLITYDINAQHLSADSGASGPVKILIEPPKPTDDEAP